jgi:hypothetical protein
MFVDFNVNIGRVEWTVLLLQVRNDAEDTVADPNNAKIKVIVSVFTGPCYISFTKKHVFYEKARAKLPLASFGQIGAPWERSGP